MSKTAFTPHIQTADLSEDSASTTCVSRLSLALCAPGELWGGVEQCVETLASRLTTLGIPVIVITLFDGPLRARLEQSGIAVTVAAGSGPYDPRAVVEIVRVLRRHRVNVLHTHGYKATILGAIAAKTVGARLVRTEHGRLEPSAGIERLKMSVHERMEIMASRYAADAVVFVSNDVRCHSATTGTARIERVIYNGIEPFSVSDDESRQVREDLSDTAGAFRVGIVGRIVPVKGHSYLLEAFRIIGSSLNARLYVFGEGPLENEHRRFSEAAGLANGVRFMGFKRNVRAYLKSLDVLVMPSLHEGLPYTLLEAMYSKVPVIASRVGGLAEVIDHGVTGILVPPADPSALAAAIERLYRDPKLRDSLAKNGFAKTCEQFLVDSMTASYIDVYTSINRQN